MRRPFQKATPRRPWAARSPHVSPRPAFRGSIRPIRTGHELELRAALSLTRTWYQTLDSAGIGIVPGNGTSIGLLITLVIGAVALWFLIELGFRRGVEGPNRYGPDPLGEQVMDASL